LESDHIIN